MCNSNMYYEIKRTIMKIETVTWKSCKPTSFLYLIFISKLWQLSINLISSKYFAYVLLMRILPIKSNDFK